jgi:type IV pilus assembly protein PilW
MLVRHAPKQAAGFSLVEMMIAIVVGIIVSGAALALVVSIMKSNADTIRATRLTQELRATAEVIARDLRRARSVTDPVANVGAATVLGSCNAISPASSDPTPSGSCITYGYDCTKPSGGSLSATFRAVGLAGGKVRLASSSTATPSCPTASSGTQLSSNAVTITGLTFTALNSDGYTIRVTGRFTNDPSSTNPLLRSITQEVRVRSAAVTP